MAPKHPEQTLQYYRQQGLLTGVQIGKRIRYTKQGLLEFLKRLTQMKSEDYLKAA